MADEREKRLEQDDQESDETEVEAHKRLHPVADNNDDSDDVEAHSLRFEKRL